MVRTPCFHRRDTGSVPGQEPEIPRARRVTHTHATRAPEAQRHSDFSKCRQEHRSPRAGTRGRAWGLRSMFPPRNPACGTSPALHQPCPPLDNSVAKLPPVPDIAILHPLLKPTLVTVFQLYDPGQPDYPGPSQFSFFCKGGTGEPTSQGH